jgi:hypothetical protein
MLLGKELKIIAIFESLVAAATLTTVMINPLLQLKRRRFDSYPLQFGVAYMVNAPK